MTIQDIPTLPVVLVGGRGTRLWPLARAGFPKPFLDWMDSRNTFLRATSRLVGVVEMDDGGVVETPNLFLVAHRSRSQPVKHAVNALASTQRDEPTAHRQVHRPSRGGYDSIDARPRLWMKRIMVEPGASLNLQAHHHRAEHPRVVSGTAQVTNGDKVINMSRWARRIACPIPARCRSKASLARVALAMALTFALAACDTLPSVGPSRKEIDDSKAQPGSAAIQIVDVDDAVARRLLAQRDLRTFAESLNAAQSPDGLVGPGDVLEISIWEAPPATLFGSSAFDPRGAAPSTRATTLPDQMVDRDGFIGVPFAGRVQAAGQTLAAVEAGIVKGLKGKANQPEVLVRMTRNASSTVTVVGEVATSVKMPLTAANEHLLDALAAAGGVRQPVSKMTVQITRGSQYFAMPLDTVIRDPRQNIALQARDVVTALFQPLSFTALGATGKNEEINFETQGISLAQALARSGGLIDSRSDAQGVFVFRLERKDALDWPRQPVATTPDDLVPVVYRVDLKNPSSFFVMQGFAINNKDIVYVSNAPGAELQKFLNLVFTVVYPIANVRQIIK